MFQGANCNFQSVSIVLWSLCREGSGLRSMELDYWLVPTAMGQFPHALCKYLHIGQADANARHDMLWTQWKINKDEVINPKLLRFWSCVSVSPFPWVEKKMLLVMLMLLFAIKKLCMARHEHAAHISRLESWKRDWTQKPAKPWLVGMAGVHRSNSDSRHILGYHSYKTDMLRCELGVCNVKSSVACGSEHRG
jgi:hypothetical protein